MAPQARSCWDAVSKNFVFSRTEGGLLVNMVGVRAGFLAAGLAFGVLGAAEGLAQDLDGLLNDESQTAEPGAQSEKAETGPAAAAAPAERTPATESSSAQAATAPATKAPAARQGRVIEEIIVTAQRTEEQLHDVPVSMSAFDDKFLHEQGISDLQDVSRYVPNVRIDQAGNLIQPR
ncbi:MAG: hypothetical protein ACRDHY_02430, partial [Anaerolineales bacterium]